MNWVISATPSFYFGGLGFHSMGKVYSGRIAFPSVQSGSRDKSIRIPETSTMEMYFGIITTEPRPDTIMSTW